MAEIGILEAKTHLSRLVERAEKGEEIVLTRHGKPVARLTPLNARRGPVDAERLRKALDELAEARRGKRLEGITLRELIEAGRGSTE